MGRRHYHPHVLREETKVQRLGQNDRGRIGTGWSRFQVWAITPCTKQPTAQGRWYDFPEERVIVHIH